MSEKKFSLGNILKKINEEEGAKQAASPESPDVSASPESQSPEEQFSRLPEKDDLPAQPVFGNGYRRTSSAPQPLSSKRWEDATKSFPGFQQPRSTDTEPFGFHLNDQRTRAGDEEEEEDFDLHRYIGIILRRRNIIIAAVVLMTIFSIFRYIGSEKYYTARARLLFHPDNQEILDESKSVRFYGDREKLFNTHLELLKSNTVLKRVCENLDNKIDIHSILYGLIVKQGEIGGEKTDIIELSFKHRDFEIARDVINELCRTYIDYRRDVNAQEITRLVYRFETQIDKLQTELNEKEGDLRQFKEENRMVHLSSETNLLVSKLSDMELELQKTQLQLVETKERLSALNSQISKQEREVVQSITYQDPFQDRLSALELELNTLSSEYSQEHFKVKTVKQQIENLKSATVDSISREAASRTMISNPIRQALLQDLINLTIEKAAAETKRIAQEQIIERLNKDLLTLPSLEQRFVYLQRETESQLQTLLMLKTKYEEAKIRRDSQESDLKILELADTPEIAVSSMKLSSIAIGVLIGIIIGIALAFLLEYLDQSLKDPSDVEKVLELPLLGIVPFMDAEKALVEQNDHSKNLLEPFRALRANLKHIASANELKTFIICSAIKGEGKTTLAANLAITFALDGRKVILLDADMRRSQLHTLFGIPKETGFSDYLLSNSTLDEIIKPTRFENLFVITSGERPNNPAELLGTVRFDMMLQEIRNKAEIIIFDSPALLPVSDTLIMAPKMDGCITVVRTLYTPLKAAKQAKNQLRRIGCKLYGAILNGLSHPGRYYPYYYGYYGYSYKYSYEDDKKSQRFSFRKFGLKIENGLKNKLSSIAFSAPKTLSSAAHFFRYLMRKKTTWILLFILMAITGLHFWFQTNNRSSTPEIFKYLGVSSSANQIDDVPPNDISSPEAQNEPGSSDIKDSVFQWINALSENDKERYLSFYDTINFKYPGGSFKEWRLSVLEESSQGSPGSSVHLNKITERKNSRNYKEILADVFEISGADTVFYSLLTLWQNGVDGWRIVGEKTINSQSY